MKQWYSQIFACVLYIYIISINIMYMCIVDGQNPAPVELDTSNSSQMHHHELVRLLPIHRMFPAARAESIVDLLL